MLFLCYSYKNYKSKFDNTNSSMGGYVLTDNLKIRHFLPSFNENWETINSQMLLCTF